MRILFELQNGLWAFDLLSSRYYIDMANAILDGKFDPSVLGEKVQESSISYYANSYGEPIRQDSNGDKYGVVELIGPIMLYDSCYQYGAQSIVGMMNRYNNDPNVKGIIMKVDTPGGAVSAINPFIDFASKKKKPVISICNQALSLGEWATDIVSDHKMASNTISSRFGSIGVVASFRNYKTYLENQGIEDHEVYADQSSYKNKDFKLAMEGDYSLLKEEFLNPLAVSFQNQVKKSRPNLDQSVEGILEGRTFDARKALEYGLIDSIGTLEDAIEMINVLNESIYNN
ncbi:MULTISPECIES: S49 family peptidase [Weeksella]|uniref:S49 family peptidase n=1 Tax=Weeksella TaxID=1013 RepID=UPI0008A3A8C0|nr:MULTISPECIES: S49 family peptidase [Weeksella]MDK7375992.1 S49 family peptidase [Weeksella virosa]OFM84586.1 hypothetical protein HMPREF2660_08730 [Weeksella sp. HMSC059D05]